MNRAVAMDMYPSKDIVGMVFGPALATLSGVILAVSQDVNQGGVSAQVLTVIASVLASTGAIGYAARKWADNYAARAREEREEVRKRAEEEREQDREARRIANEHIERMFSQAERHATRMEELYIAERLRNDTLVRDLVGTSTDS